jgi:hypothetical protein
MKTDEKQTNQTCLHLKRRAGNRASPAVEKAFVIRLGKAVCIPRRVWPEGPREPPVAADVRRL